MKDKKYPKPTKLFSAKRLHSIWNASKDSKGAGGAPGLDRITPIIFARSLEKNLNRIVENIRTEKFRFQSLRASPIEKGNGKQRIICIPSVRDRLTQRAILRYLTGTDENPKDLLKVRNENSYGAAKGKEQGTHAAIDEAIRRRSVKPYVLKTDISKFFDNIPRDYLLGRIKSRLGMRSVVPLLEQVVNCEIREKNDTVREQIIRAGITTGKGLRQGMPLSPLLSNLVLGKFDAMLAKRGKSYLRYVDDLVVFEDGEEECKKTFLLVENELTKLGLTIPGLGTDLSKSEVILPKDEVVFLGLSIYQSKNGKYAKRIPNAAFKKIASTIETDVSYENFEVAGSKKSKKFHEYNIWFDSMKRGYCAAYSGATNLQQFEQHVDTLIKDAKNRLIEQIMGVPVNTIDPKKLRFLGLS